MAIISWTEGIILMKQELIEKIKQNQIKDRIESEYTGGINEGLRIAISCVEKAFEQSKEIVPQFVADWFETNKNDLTFAIYEAVAHSYKLVEHDQYPTGFMEWFGTSSNNAFDTLIRMKDGYEVKETATYRVKIGNGYFIKFQSNGCLVSPHETDGIMEFESKQDAERVANTIGGIVVKVDEP